MCRRPLWGPADHLVAGQVSRRSRNVPLALLVSGVKGRCRALPWHRTKTASLSIHQDASGCRTSALWGVWLKPFGRSDRSGLGIAKPRAYRASSRPLASDSNGRMLRRTRINLSPVAPSLPWESWWCTCDPSFVPKNRLSFPGGPVGAAAGPQLTVDGSRRGRPEEGCRAARSISGRSGSRRSGFLFPMYH